MVNFKDMSIVRDENGNELFCATNEHECLEWCKENNVTGENGEYIASGLFYPDDKYFDVMDYIMIDFNFI